jgi:hypothetical protein
MPRRDDSSDSFDAIKGVVNYIPGIPGDVLGAGVEYIDGANRAEIESAAIADAGMNLRHSYSRVARRKLENLENMPTKNLAKYAVQIAAGVVGGFIGAALLAFLPFGAFIGGLAGTIVFGYVAGTIYENAIDRTEQDAVNLAVNSYRKVHNREAISKEEAFATLMSVLPERVQSRYEDMLEKRIGTRDFAVALESREGLNALHGMMNDSYINHVIRKFAHIPSNPQAPGQRVADQYAELVNSGVLDPRTIILDPDNIHAIVTRHYAQQTVLGNTVIAAENDVSASQQLPSAGADRGLGGRTT